MDLYNLYKEIILEAIGANEVLTSIGNRQVIDIYYAGDKTVNKGRRIIEVYTYGLSKAGNPVIRAYQLKGATDTEIPGWKIFRLDKIKNWKPIKGWRIKRPISDRKPGVPKFNPLGDKSFKKVYRIINFKKKK